MRKIEIAYKQVSMPLIPFRHSMFELFDDEFEKMLQEFRSRHPMKKEEGFMPAVDVYEKGDNVIVEAPLPGIDPKDVEVSLDSGVLTIKGKKEHKKEVDEKDYYHKEVRYGVFARSVQMPVTVLPEKAEATTENGVLKIMVPKAPAEKPDSKINIEIK